MPRRRHPPPRPNRRRDPHAWPPAGRRTRRRDARHAAPRPAAVPAHVQAEIDAMLAASYVVPVPRFELDRLDRVRITVADPRGGPDRRITALEALGL